MTKVEIVTGDAAIIVECDSAVIGNGGALILRRLVRETLPSGRVAEVERTISVYSPHHWDCLHYLSDDGSAT